MKHTIFVFIFLLITGSVGAENIREWACWGPGWGRSGLAAAGANYEAGLMPQPGDLDLSLGTDRLRMLPWIKYSSADGTIDFYSKRFPVKNILDAAGKWAGGASYAAVYLKSEKQKSFRLYLSTSQKADVWLGSEKLKSQDGFYMCRLDSGWKRLLIKVLSPSVIRRKTIILPQEGKSSNWTLKAELCGEDGNRNIKGVSLSPEDPSRSPSRDCLRFLSRLSGKDGENPLFSIGKWDGTLILNITAASGKAENYPISPEKRYSPRTEHWIYTHAPEKNSPVLTAAELREKLPAELLITIVDYAGKTLPPVREKLVFDSRNSSTVILKPERSRRLPEYYAVRLSYLDQSGKVMAYDHHHSFALVKGPVPAEAEVPRKISAVGHWLTNPDEFETIERKLLWMHTAGITWHQKMSQVWNRWGITSDGRGTIKFSPRENVDKTIELAQKLNITLIGDLTMGYVQTDSKRNGQMMPLTDVEAESGKEAGEEIQQARKIRLIPLGARPLPYYGTPEFNKSLHDYAYTLASYYKGKIKYWCGDNEIDLHAGKAGKAEAVVYAAAAQQIYQAMKEGNPEATFISASICRNNSFTKELFQNGFGDHCDIIDVHAHPCNPPNLSDSTIGNTPNEGFGAAAKYSSKPIVYGELSSPLAHSPSGTIGQAEAVPKQVAWALNQKRIKLLSYLVPYSNGANLGFCNVYGDPHPAACSLNAASHLIDGKKQLEPLSLPDGIQQLRVKEKEGDMFLLWADKTTEIKIPLPSGQAVVYDLFGRPVQETEHAAYITVTLSETPVYLRRK